MLRIRIVPGVLLFVLALAPSSALSQPYRIVQVAPLPGHEVARLSDLNDHLQAIGFSSSADRSSQAIEWDLLNGTRPGPGGVSFINNAGKMVGFRSWLDDTPPYVHAELVEVSNGIRSTLPLEMPLDWPRPYRALWALQATDSGLVLLRTGNNIPATYLVREGRVRFFGGYHTGADACAGVTSITENGIGVLACWNQPSSYRAYAVSPDGGALPLWKIAHRGDIYSLWWSSPAIGLTGYVAQPHGGRLLIASPDGHIHEPALPSGQFVSRVIRPNAAGDVAGTGAWPFVYRNGTFINLETAAGLPPGSIREVTKITNTGAILVSVQVPFRSEGWWTDLILIPTAPAPPSGVSFSVAQRVVTLSWQSSLGATDYIIEAGSWPGSANLFNGPVGDITSIAAAVPPGRYYVRLRARNDAGPGPPSDEMIIDVP